MPHLTYCHLVWHFCTASDSRKLERLQERALRLVYNTITESYDTLLKRAKLTTLQNRAPGYRTLLSLRADLPEYLGQNNAQNVQTPLADFWRRLERFLMRRQE